MPAQTLRHWSRVSGIPEGILRFHAVRLGLMRPSRATPGDALDPNAAFQIFAAVMSATDFQATAQRFAGAAWSTQHR